MGITQDRICWQVLVLVQLNSFVILVGASILRKCSGMASIVNQVSFTLVCLTFRHRASCILGQALSYSPENAFYVFNQQIYFII